MGMANLQRMAQQMQQEMLRVQGELESATVDGSAGGGVVSATVTGKQELVSVTIDPSAVDPDGRRDAPGPGRGGGQRRPARLARAGRAEDGRGDRRPAPPGHVGRPAVATPVIEPVARLIEAFARLPGIGPKTAQRLTYHLLRAPDAEARTLAAALVAVRDQVVFCDRCFNITRPAALPDLPRSGPRRDAAVRRRGAAGRAGPRADRRVQGPLPRPPRRHLADRRDRPGSPQDPRAAGARRRGRARRVRRSRR